MALSAERKIVAPAHWTDFGRSWLAHACAPDPKYPVGCVNSIYFDTPRLAAFHEKDNGDFLKTKIRLRWYRESQAQHAVAFLEIKERVGAARRKARATLKADAAWINTVALESGEVEEFLRQEAGEWSYLFERDVIPVMTIVYDRYRYTCPVTGARVCLDTNIHSDRVNSRHLGSAVPEGIDRIVAEIKGPQTDDIPWVEELYHHGFRAGSFSKYYECMVQSLSGGVKYE